MTGNAPGDFDSVERLLAAFRAGDVEASERLLPRFEPWLRLVARLELDSRLNARLDPSDVVQQTLLEAHRGLRAFRGGSPGELAAWLRGILAHVLAHEVRRHVGAQKRDATREASIEECLARSSMRLAALAAAAGASPSENAIAHERERLLADALERLPADHREVLLLRHFENLSHGEIAARMGRSVGAVRMLWVRALKGLREGLAALESRP